MSESSNSTQGLFLIRITVLSAILLGIVASLTSAKAADDKGGLRFAMVNPGRLISEYKYAKTSREALQKLDNEASVTIATYRQFPLLTTQDQDAMVKLVLKESAAPNDVTKAEKDLLAQLKTKHEGLVKEYNDLLGKPNGATTPKDAAQLESLNKLQNDTQVRMNAKQKSAKDEITVEEEKINVKIDADVRAALNKVAKDKGMNLVFSSQAVLFADSDITDDVLNKLNK